MSYPRKDELGVKEVGAEVRHLRSGWHGTVAEVLPDDRVSVIFRGRGLRSLVPVRMLETLLEQKRRHAEAWRRRGGSVEPQEVDERRPWTPEDERYLLRAHAAGVPDPITAEELGRTVVAVHTRRFELAELLVAK